ncbi:carboxylate-amine ligase [Paeniglutamicibacter kerguelensis]|uniref:Putative glutamate--cysteine ligase 2 n=1 Tax=Paeniglutamicibacter kerguelensis TaxID=254788 RepID=A0ABS4XCN7_9MICC|nr:glutamate--cysteine ligase [Paeniglutamicibacter kerguelensis]MBP2386226.1 carboxylate-amine ligase [Paeniglutamicibacter kerguelensis]
MSTFGIEEEFFLLHPQTGLPAVPDAAASAALMSIHAGGNTTQSELLACQVETATPICVDGLAALASLREYRKELARTVQGLNLLPVSMGTIPMVPAGAAKIADQERYRRMHEFLPGISGDQYVSGLHVHVSVPDPDAGVVALNGLRPWLPLLMALGSNSPFWRGADTGFASWRSIHYRRWSVQGIQPHFADARDYQRRLATLLASDVVLDQGHIGWAARLSSRYPTVEIRIADAQLRSEDSVLLALMVRALVDTCLHDTSATDHLLPEVLDLAFWQAAKHGMKGNQVAPETGQATSTEKQLAALLDHIRDALAANGDSDFVLSGLERLARGGNGAQRQRDSYARGGLRQVISDANEELTA